MILERVKQANDIKHIPNDELNQLAEEIRNFLIENISKTGGHLASNLGVVELTMALHLSLDLPKDKIIWDVGHQSYTHKILTGRKDEFASLRQYKGLSGFPKREESPCDAYDTGHSSTSISAGLGYAHARDLNNGSEYIVAVIGDGALTGGIAYEALNNASNLKSNFIIVLNDNNMSISENVGGMSAQLGRMRTTNFYNGLKKGVIDSLQKLPVVGEPLIKGIRRTKDSIKQLFIPGMFFEEMGITYLGPVDGHDISQMLSVFQAAKNVEGPVLVHVITTKGKGYSLAERHPSRFHGTAPFEIETGLAAGSVPSYTDIFSTVMRKMGDRDEKVVAITAAMEDGTGLKRFHNMFPHRFFDVGIAEQHAVSFAAGMALGGLKPVVAVYSSFLQRGYDEIVQDVCLQNLPVVFAIDRAGLVGSDGPTHHGVFDLAYLTTIPNMTVMAPKNIWEFSDMLKFAINYEAPIAVRYPRGAAYDGLKDVRNPIELGKSEWIIRGSRVALLCFGAMVKTGVEVAEILKEHGIFATLINMRFAKPIDTKMCEEVLKDHSIIVTLEDHSRIGGIGDLVSSYYASIDKMPEHFISVGIPDHFIEQGSVQQLYKECGMDADSIVHEILKKYEESNG